jgi:hypothetical protein
MITARPAGTQGRLQEKMRKTFLLPRAVGFEAVLASTAAVGAVATVRRTDRRKRGRSCAQSLMGYWKNRANLTTWLAARNLGSGEMRA